MKTKHLVEKLMKADKNLPYLVNTLLDGACSSKKNCECRIKMKQNKTTIIDFLNKKAVYCDKVKNKSLNSLSNNPMIVFASGSLIEDYCFRNRETKVSENEIIACNMV